MNLLHIYAVNGDLGDLRHTNLTRAQEDPVPDLPNLAEWLGTPVDLSAIELFPVADLKPLRLTDYLRDGFDADEKTLAPHAGRLGALQGHVLLVPDDALTGTPKPGASLTAIASLPLPRADQSQAAVPSMKEPSQAAAPAPEPEPPRKKPMSDARMSGMVAMAALAVLFGLTAIMVWIGG